MVHVRSARAKCSGAPSIRGLTVFGIGLALTGGALALLHYVVEPSRAFELLVLMLANLIATVVRFALLRGWVFHPRRVGAN